MRRRNVLCLVVCCILLLATGVAVHAAVLGMEVVADNGLMILYINRDTTEIAIEDKATGVTWFSNPQGRDLKKSVGHEVLSIRYDAPAATDRTMNSFTDSVQYGQYEIILIQDGVRVEYVLGKLYDSSKLGLPQMISKERYESLIYANITDARDRSQLERYYRVVSLEKPTSAEQVSSRGLRQIEQRLFGEYILVSHDESYQKLKKEILELEAELEGLPKDSSQLSAVQDKLRRSRISMDKMRGDLVYGLLEKFTGYAIGGVDSKTDGYRKGVDKDTDLTPEDFYHLIENPTYLLGKMPPFVAKQINDLLPDIGYGLEELTSDHLANRLDPPLPNVAVFKIPVEYVLQGRDLVVRIPGDEIEYPQEVFVDFKIDFNAGPDEEFVIPDRSGAKETYPLTSISLLRFFGAADASQRGYMFVPDGAGALIYLNNGKTNLPLYSEPVYGSDPSIPVEETLAYTKQTNHLPVFGMKQGDQAFLAVIEEGEALASIRADIARESNPYNTVFAAFSTIPKSERRLDLHTKITVYQRRIYQGDIQVRYRFLEGEEADYSGMARSYRSYLLDRGVLRERPSTADVPFFLELTGSISAIEPILGVPREVTIPLTTFDQAKQLVEQLNARGIQGVQVRYTGWLDGGLEHYFPSGVNLAKEIGTKEQLETLNRIVNEQNGVLYPDVRFMEVYKSRLFDGFSSKRDSARAISGLIGKVSPYDPVLLSPLETESHYLLSPARLGTLVDGFIKEYREFKMEGISLSQFGTSVHADYRSNVDSVIDRQQASQIVEKQLAQFKNQGKSVLVDGGNAFALPYVDSLINMPLQGTNFNLVDEEVPFFPMVVRGYLDYAGHPLNFASDIRHDVLKAIETGAAIQFSWIFQNPEKIKGTKFGSLYSVYCERWFERAVEIYGEVSTALDGLSGQQIIRHTKLEGGVYLTEFSNGDAVLVNYNTQPVSVDGKAVEGMSFVRLKKGGEWQ